MKYQDMLDKLFSLARKGSKLGLDPITQACSYFKNPQNNIGKIIHIAGTNGKGSVAAMTTSILRQAGYSVGLYTSPHLVDFRERIKFNKENISKDDFLRLYQKINQANLDLTFFEFTTLLAFLYFQEKKPDFSVIEVGLGGKLDATNIVVPDLSIITNISLDHTHILGNTLELITKDKCGIIKSAPVITSNNNSPVINIIKKICKEKKVPLTISTNYQGKLSLLGQFQHQNAGIAVEIAKHFSVSNSIIESALTHVLWPGRIDFIEKNLLLDGAHNPAGIRALSNYISTLNYSNLIIIFGVSSGKNYKEMISLLPKYKNLITTKANISRAINPSDIDINSIQEPNISKALEKARSLAEKDDLILVTGSLYLIGDLLKHLSGRTDPTINEFI